MMMYLPHKLKQLFNPYPDLRLRGSLLRRAFGLLDQNKTVEARQLWYKELYGLTLHPNQNPRACFNMWDSTEISYDIEFWERTRFRDKVRACHIHGQRVEGEHPLRRTFEWVFTKTGKCLREGGCIAPIAMDEESGGEKERVVKTAGYTTGTYRTPVAILDSYLKDSAVNNCHDPCKGPTYWEESKVIQWPHTLIIVRGGGANESPEDWPTSFIYRDKRFLLRGATLCNSTHFRSCTKVKDGWLLYDGMWEGTQLIQFHKSADRATVGDYQVDTVIYEVVSTRTTAHFKEELDFRDVLVTDSGESAVDEADESDRMEDKLHELSKSLATQSKSKASSPKKKKKKAAKVKKKTVASGSAKSKTGGGNSVRDCPSGWSMRKKVEGELPGRKVACPSCDRPVLGSDDCVRYTYMKNRCHKHPTTDQYHFDLICLVKMREQDRGRYYEFISHPWPRPEAMLMVEKLKKIQ